MEENFTKKLVNFLISAGIFILEMIKVAVLAGITIALIRYYLFKPFYVKGASMEPNFHEKEYLIIDELSFRFREPVRGEVIVFRFPEDPKEYFLKRVIGLPGETVKVQGGKVYIYNSENPEGFLLDENYLPDSLITDGDRTTKVGENQLFVLGDNRPNSFDSRRFGPIDKSLVVGRAWLRGWPLNKLAVFSTP
ncbi:MAG TPA: signal peptidase I [Candidatus Magasanikbacteria bacterium]|nr:signal peptidase I [Candidatus Magasanikbacteria bacterium]